MIHLINMMKKIVLILGCGLVFCDCFSQAPPWTWAKSAGGTDPDNANSNCTDASGNVFVTGMYKSSSITFGTTTLTNAGDYDIFIVKYDSYGNVLWAKGIGGSTDDKAFDITSDPNGNVIVTGVFTSSSITFGTTTLTNAGAANMFVVKYDNSGNVIWAKSVVGNNFAHVIGWSVCADAGSNVFVAGSFRNGAITFGTITLLTYGGTYYDDLYILKYDSSGNLLWANSAGGTGGDLPNSVCVDASGNIIAAGFFQSSFMIIGADTLNNATGGTGYADIFIVKYDAAGNLLSAKREGGNNDDYATGISTDANGNAYATGYFESDTIIIGTDTLIDSYAGNQTVFTVKYDNSGNVLWAKCPIGASNQAFDIATDAGNNVIVTGNFAGSSIIFGSDTLNFVSSSGSQLFVVKYDGSGNAVLVKSAKGSSGCVGRSVSADAGGNVYVSGDFLGATVIFDLDTLTGYGDMFLAKLGVSTGIADLQFPPFNLQLFPNPSASGGTIQLTFSTKHNAPVG